MTLALVWLSQRLGLIDISDINDIKGLGSVPLPGMPVCLKVVNTASGWTAYCAQNNGYISVIRGTSQGMTKIIDISLDNAGKANFLDVSLDLSVDNKWVYAMTTSSGTNIKQMFVLDTTSLALTNGLAEFFNGWAKILYQLGSVNYLCTPETSPANQLTISFWSVGQNPPTLAKSFILYGVPFINDQKNTAKSFNGFQDSLVYICNPSNNIITGIRVLGNLSYTQLPNITLPANMTALAPVSNDGKAYVSAGANLCIVDKDKGVIQTIPLNSSAKAIDVSSDSSAAYLLLSGGFNDNVYKVDFKRLNIITQGRLPWLNPTGFTLIPPANPQTRNVSNSGCSCKKKKKE
ncbi:MAG: hypothetical protein JSR76_02095 [Verrucomicrobia bacterium]|nr:hypothetical protein [Verrucomicrobiota bacterium]